MSVLVLTIPETVMSPCATDDGMFLATIGSWSTSILGSAGPGRTELSVFTSLGVREGYQHAGKRYGSSPKRYGVPVRVAVPVCQNYSMVNKGILFQKVTY